MLHADNLTFSYDIPARSGKAPAPDADATRLPVLRGLSLHIGRGESVLIRGVSGCGKSTLLRVIARLEALQQGTISLDGADIRGIEPTVYRRRVAYLQQIPVMIEGSVRDNLLLAFRYAGETPPKDVELRARLEEVELADLRLDASAAELSVGQQQRLALLRLLAMQPELLLLDEPTAALDAESAALLLRAITRQHDAHRLSMLIVAHHDLPLGGRAVRIVRMRDGRLDDNGAGS